MSFIAVNLTEAVESRPVPAGRYDVTINSIPEETLTKEKKIPQLVVTLDILGHDNAPQVRHYMSIPQQDDEPKKFSFKVLLLRRFCEAFGIPFDAEGFNLDDFVGATATVELQLSEPDGNGNVYNRLVVPPMKGENENRPPKR
jgi:hypothetical protein